MTVVLSPGLVITPIAGETALNPYIGWHNLVRFGNVSADHAAADYPASNLANPSTANWWLSDSTDEQTILVSDLDADTNYVAFARHNFGSGQTTVSVEGETPDGFEVIFAGILPADDGPLLIRFAEASYISLRVRLMPTDAVPRVAVLFAGKLIVVPTGIEPGYTPISEGQEAELVGGRSESGEFLGAILVGSSLSTSTPFKRLPRDWYELVMRPFIRAANAGAPFFFAWSPSLHPDQVGYCWFDGSAKPVISQTDGSYDIALPLQGVAL